MLKRLLLATAALAVLTSSADVLAQNGNGNGNNGTGNDKWVVSWATSPATFFTYVAPVAPAPPGPPTTFAPANIQPDLKYPFPNANTSGATDQTIRSIVKPDLWGNTVRLRFSNVFGTQPVTFSAVTVALEEYAANLVPGTVTPITFGGSKSVTIPVGQWIVSDTTVLSWVSGANDKSIVGRNLAVSYAIQGSSGPMTYHAGANQTSFVTGPGTGDHTADEDGFAYDFTTTSWFFINAVDVKAAPDTVVVVAFGDSITDGTHTTLNENDRWMNVLSRRLHDAYGNHVSIVNAGIGGNRVVNPVVANAASGPAAVDRLNRDVLSLSGITDVIWLEGINDLGGGHTTDAIIGGYKDVVARVHAANVRIYGGTMTSALGIAPTDGTPTADNGPGHDANRKVLNDFIRTSGLFDGVEDFDAATLDTATGNMKEVFLPNSQFTQLPWDYLHPNHAGYNAMGQVVDIGPFAPGHGR